MLLLAKALKERPVKRTMASVCIVWEQSLALEISKIANFMQSLHNSRVQFTQRDLRVWKAFNVGSGKFISRNETVIFPQKKKEMVPANALSLVAMKIK